MVAKVDKLEICAGYRPEKMGSEWIRHDLRKHKHINLRCDVWELPEFLLNALPLREIYCKNFIEHLSVNDGVHFIRMCRNMLKENGELTLVTANMDWLIDQYRAGNYDDPEDFLMWFFGGTGDEWWNLHKTMYNEELLRRRFIQAGDWTTAAKYEDDGYRLIVTGKKVRVLPSEIDEVDDLI